MRAVVSVLAGVTVLTLIAFSGVVEPVDAGEKMSHLEEARVELGRRLFFDPAVSQSGRVSCASCHVPEHNYGDPKVQSDDDVGPTTHHSQTLIDSAFNPTAHRDGEFDSIESLVIARLGSRVTGTSTQVGYGFRSRQTTPALQPGPMARRPDMKKLQQDQRNGNVTTAVADRLQATGVYDTAFKAAFGKPDISLAHMARALGDFIRTIESKEAPIDRFLAGDATAIDRSALHGLALFRGRAGCAQCHTMDVHDHVGKPLFTDFDFHNTGVNKKLLNATSTRRIASVTNPMHTGRFRLTRQPQDFGSFKTPSLRDVARRTPYMHDGSMKTLEEVVRHYAAGGLTTDGKPGRFRDKRIRPFKVSDEDVADLVAFLHTLSGYTHAGTNDVHWKKRAKTTTITFLDQGKPAKGITVVLEDVGGRVPGVERTEPLVLKTDSRGRVKFKPGARTHTRIVEPASVEQQQWSWIPDTCKRCEIELSGAHTVEVTVSDSRDAKDPEAMPTRILADRTDRKGTVVLERIDEPVDKRPATYRAWVPNELDKVDVMLRGSFRVVPTAEKPATPAPDAKVDPNRLRRIARTHVGNLRVTLTTGTPLPLERAITNFRFGISRR